MAILVIQVWAGRVVRYLSIATIVGLSSHTAHALDGDTFRPFVSYAHYYDSNLFRLAVNENPGRQRDERYSVLSAGLNLDWKPGRQQVIANATKTRVRYDLNTAFDSDGSDYQATWNWRLGNRLSGNLGASESLSQSNFDSVGLVNNQVTRERRFARGEWEFHPRWRVGLGTEESNNENSDLQSQDFTQKAHDLSLTYRTPKGSLMRFQARRTNAEYPNRQITSLFQIIDNSFTQNDYNVQGEWRVSGKLTGRVQLGHTTRAHPNFPLRDYSGLTGRLSGDWFPTAKTLLSLSAYQELGGADDINANFALRTGTSLSGVWIAREKWRLNARASFENRDFQGDTGIGLVRNDDTLSISLSVSYTPVRSVTLDVGLNAGSRESNISVEDYSFDSVFASVRADF